MRRCCSTIIIFIVCSTLNAQLINEHVFPKLPLKSTTAEIISAQNSFVLKGMNWTQWYAPPPLDWGGGSYYPFYLRWNGTALSKPFFLPDSGYEEIYSFDHKADRFKIASVQTASGDIGVMWSVVRTFWSDVPPMYLYKPRRGYAYTSPSLFKKILIDSAGLNPSIALTDDNGIHYVWESVMPMNVDPHRNYFEEFSSTIHYQVMNLDGTGFPAFITVGKGFYPEVKVRKNVPYVLWYSADSSSSPQLVMTVKKIFEDSAVIYTYPIRQEGSIWGRGDIIAQEPIVQSLSWDIDTSGGAHSAWLSNGVDRRITVLHKEPGKDLFVDTSKSIITGMLKTRYMPGGEMRIMCSDGNGVLHYFISAAGQLIQEKQTIDLKSENAVLRDYLVDIHGNEHAVVQNMYGVKGLYLVKFIGTDSTKSFLLSNEYTTGTTSHIDSTNTVWMTGQRDSTPVLLSFRLDDVGRYEDFVFPLRIGNEWHYGVYSDPPPPWPDYTDIQKINSDTLMSNGMRYFVMTAQMIPTRFLRKDGLKIFQYNPADSNEHLRYDFSRSEGDTISSKIILKKIETLNIFGVPRRSFRFDGSIVPNSYDWRIQIVDSIGIYSNEVLGPSWKLLGAKINGKVYGTILSVEEGEHRLPSFFSLSQNYPNPFNPSTTIEYQLPRHSFVSLKIYDLLGREVASLVNEEMNAGVHKATWNGANFSSGMYFARMTAGQFASTKKLLLLK
ncbi:MAG: T9SS type A sorting domain-containing protein [Ignavibacteriales bacterium]|nr:T9SS type A sorting domain-containing protein [Ignavibacteriales bacterium]